VTRRLLLVPVALVVAAVLATWFMDCTHSLCRLLNLYTYEVSSLDEFREHLAGADLHARHQAHRLRFDEKALRRQVAAAMHKQLGDIYARNMAPEKATRLIHSGLARVEGRALHLTDEVRYGKETLGAWAVSIKAFMADEQRDATQQVYQAELKALFDEIVIHTGETMERVTLAEARGSD
jgi:hypothetical protein